jgi:hypothetical protein
VDHGPGSEGFPFDTETMLVSVSGARVRCRLRLPHLWSEGTTRVIRLRRRCNRNSRIPGRRIREVEHVLERASVEIAGCQMRSLGVVIEAQETLLNERQKRSVVRHPVRDVMWPRERGDRNEGHAEAELIEVRA